MLEPNSQEMCARVVVVDVPNDVQVERTAKRDKVPTDQVEQMVSAQMEREKRLEKADDVLLNTSTIEELEKKVEQLHEKYLQMVE